MQPFSLLSEAASGAAVINPNTPIFHDRNKFEYEETTLQVPFGEFSILEALKAGKVKPIDAIVTLTLGYRSNWSSGLTWRTSTRTLAKVIGISHRYVRNVINRATDWISRQTQPVGNTAGTWQVTRHLCDRDEVPTDRDGLPCMFAVPRGEGGPFERMFAGDISWKACLIWLLLKLHSDWEKKDGITTPMNMDTLCKWTGFGKATVIAKIKELIDAGMLERLSHRWDRSVFQLYPKPRTEPRAVRRRKKRAEKKAKSRLDPNGDRLMRDDGDWRFSFNEKYRVNVVTGEIQTRSGYGRGVWQPTSEYHRAQVMPKAIRVAFQQAVEAAQSLQAIFGKSKESRTIPTTRPVLMSNRTTTSSPVFFLMRHPVTAAWTLYIAFLACNPFANLRRNFFGWCQNVIDYDLFDDFTERLIILVVNFFLKTLSIGALVGEFDILFLFFAGIYWAVVLTRNSQLTTSHAMLLWWMRMLVRTAAFVTVNRQRHYEHTQT
jgi:hypothetical protein